MPNDPELAGSSSGNSSTDGMDLEVKPWTVMVYMAGNNNLSENMAFSLESLHEFGGSLSPDDRSKVNLLAYFDGSSLTAPTHYIDYSDLKQPNEPHREPVTNKHKYHRSRSSEERASGASESVHAPINDDSASAYSIMNFVRWCIVDRKRRAQNYAVIFSGHSFGFHGTSFMRDDSAGSHLTLFRFRWALDEVNKEYLEGQNNEKIAILGFDSCVMSMLEIGYELKGVAQTIVASEGSLPNSGWGYAPMLKEFLTAYQKEAEAAPAEKASFLAPEYVKNAATKFVVAFTDQQRRLALGGRSIDISSWDLDHVDELALAVNELGRFLNRNLLLDPYSISNEKLFLRQEMKKVVLQSQYDAQSYMKDQCVDLRDFCQRLSFESKFLHEGPFASHFQDLSSLSEKVIGAVDKCVLKCGYSGDEYQYSNGISVFFPWSHLAFSIAAYKYRYLWFNRGRQWRPHHRRIRQRHMQVRAEPGRTQRLVFPAFVCIQGKHAMQTRKQRLLA